MNFMSQSNSFPGVTLKVKSNYFNSFIIVMKCPVISYSRLKQNTHLILMYYSLKSTSIHPFLPDRIATSREVKEIICETMRTEKKEKYINKVHLNPSDAL